MMTSAQTGRVLGHAKARELTAAEIDQVAGGPTYTGVSNVEFTDIDGDGSIDEISFNYSDYDPRP